MNLETVFFACRPFYWSHPRAELLVLDFCYFPDETKAKTHIREQKKSTTKQDKTTHDKKARQHKTAQVNKTRQATTRHDTTRQDKTRQEKTWQDRTR
jgi:hypothetical protein